MNCLSRLLAILVPVLVAVGQITAETEVSVSGQVRYRAEIDGRSFDPGDVSGEYQLLRTRINIEALVDSNTHAFIQFQDSRTLGGADQFGAWQSGGLNDGKNVDLHQAYVQFDRVWFDGLGLKGGRFELSLGGQRLFGAVGWHNVGRAWEGGLGWYQGESVCLSAFWLKAQEEGETSAALANRDFDIFGAHLRFDRADLELLGVYEIDNDTLYRASDNTVMAGRRLGRITAGFYYHRSLGQLDLEFNGAYQFGQMADTVDIAATMFTGEVGYSPEGDRDLRLAVGIDYSSGDDDPSDLDYEAFNNLYYTGHKYRGYMDYFVASDAAGLIDMMLRGRFNPHPQWTVKGDFHYFKTARDYRIPSDVYGAMARTSDVGMEFDLTVSTGSVAGATLVGGVSLFVPQEAFVTQYFYALTDPDEPAEDRAGQALTKTNDDATTWMFVQATVDF